MINVPCRDKNITCTFRTDTGDCSLELPCNATIYD